MGWNGMGRVVCLILIDHLCKCGCAPVCLGLVVVVYVVWGPPPSLIAFSKQTKDDDYDIFMMSTPELAFWIPSLPSHTQEANPPTLDNPNAALPAPPSRALTPTRTHRERCLDNPNADGRRDLLLLPPARPSEFPFLGGAGGDL
jgi:hypothetical protein